MANDVIARLYPFDNEETTRKVRECCHCEVVQRPSSLPTPGASAHSHQEAIVLRFSRRPKTDRGFVFGRNSENCDCVLPAFHGISNTHFVITFDESHRLVLDDFSTTGTMVTYNGQGGERRRNFRWIIGEDEFVLDKRILVTISSITFEVVVPHYDRPVLAYEQNRLAWTDRRFDWITAPALTHPLLIRSYLGDGGFGWVYRVWNASSGSSYAEKTAKSQSGAREALQKEINVMRSISHASIRAGSRRVSH